MASAGAAARHAIDVFDPAVAREHSRTEALKTMQATQRSAPNYRKMDEAAKERQAKLLEAIAKEKALRRAREEERRKRDPTYRPDAVELSFSDVKPFDPHVDYYAHLECSEFASHV